MKYIAFLILILFSFSFCGAKSVKNVNKTIAKRYDCFQAAVQAQGCKVEILINDKPNKNLSGNATNGLASMAPLTQSELLPSNKITVKISGVTEEPSVLVNITGVSMDAEQFVSTDEEGDVFSLDINSEKISSSKTKVFSGAFIANFSGVYQPMDSMAPVWTYVHYFVDLIQKKEAEKFATEIFEGFKRNLKENKQSDTELKMELVKSCKELFSTAKFKKMDKKDISLFPLFGGMEYKLASAESNLVQFRDHGEWRSLPIIIAKKDGKIKIVSFKWTDY